MKQALIIALFIVAVCAQPYPEDPLHHFSKQMLEQLEDTESDPLSPGQVHDILVKLSEHYTDYLYEEEDQLDADELAMRRHYKLLAELGEISESKCTASHVAGMMVLSGLHANTPNLAQYIDWSTAVQMAVCDRMGLSKRLSGIQLANDLL